VRGGAGAQLDEQANGAPDTGDDIEDGEILDETAVAPAGPETGANGTDAPHPATDHAPTTGQAGLATGPTALPEYVAEPDRGAATASATVWDERRATDPVPEECRPRPEDRHRSFKLIVDPELDALSRRKSGGVVTRVERVERWNGEGVRAAR